MSEIITDDPAITANPFVNFFIPEPRIDMRVVLLALKFELINRKLIFKSHRGERADVIVPSLRFSFKTYYKDGYIILKSRKTMKIPCTFDGEGASDETIDVLCACIESLKLNHPFT